MEKINVAKLLKDCPKGMELDCILVSNPVRYNGLDDDVYLIDICTEYGNHFYLTKEGYIYALPDSKCVIFPKGKTTWEGFHSPFEDGDDVHNNFHLWTIQDAKDGDVLVDKDNNIGIFQKFEGIYWYSYIYLGCDGKLRGFSIGGSHKQTDVHPATKEQRDLLFQKIKEAGYCWNDKTKTLEKLIIPKFKGGDKIRSKNKKDECFYILHVDEDKHKYVLNIKGYCLEFKDQDHYELVSDTSIEPKFKVGDKVRHKNNHNIVFTITNIGEDYYACGTNKAFWFSERDDYELVPDKFDISTLKPFDKVLIRDNNSARWDITFYELYDNKNKSYPYRTLGGNIYKYCIPYEGNEHLLGKNDDCVEFYKTWE